MASGFIGAVCARDDDGGRRRIARLGDRVDTTSTPKEINIAICTTKILPRPWRWLSASSRPASCMLNVLASRVLLFQNLLHAALPAACQSTPSCSRKCLSSETMMARISAGKISARRRPCLPQHGFVEAQAVYQLAIARQQSCFGRHVAGLNLGKSRQCQRWQGQQQASDTKMCGQLPRNSKSRHHRTSGASSSSFGLPGRAGKC